MIQKWRVIGEGIAGIVSLGYTIPLSPLLRPWYRAWGATADEAQRGLPGDELVPHPKSELTCAITIRAPAERVWPWVAQIGCRRAGWYSYDLLDNGGVESARRILPEHQHLEVGQSVAATPDGKVSYPVAMIEPGRALILGGTLDTRTGKPADPTDPSLVAYFGGSNLFYLDELTQGTTRLILRLRLDWNPTVVNILAYRVFLEPISFVMARKMLWGIRERSEA